MKNKIVKIIGSSLALVLMGQSGAIANQTVNIDLNSFQSDGLGRVYPNYTISGVSDGDVITINVSNSTQGFLGYINDGAGNSINISNGGALNVTNNTGQFYGAGTLSSVSYDNTIVGSYTVTVNLGANSLLSRNVATETAVADDTSNPQAAVGWLVLSWRDGLVNEANWKQISLVRSAPSLKSADFLVGVTAPTLNLVDGKATCTSGTYKFASGAAADTGALIYTLLINNQPVSRVATSEAMAVAPYMYVPVAANLAGTASKDSATWDVSKLSNYDAQCEVAAIKSSASLKVLSNSVTDAAKLAAIAAKERAWDLERAAATAANFSKEAREKRKRLAALANR